jgi:hypothetical protein
MSATVVEAATDNWTITIDDSASGHRWSFQMPVTISLPGASAEWIMEAPSVRHIATLPNYNNFTFDPRHRQRR